MFFVKYKIKNSNCGNSQKKDKLKCQLKLKNIYVMKF